VAGLFLAASLLPSLLPRSGLMQGVLSGITVALGYGVGTSLAAIWRALQVPGLPARAQRVVVVVLVGLLVAALSISAWQYVGWQNDQRARMGMASISPKEWPTMLVVGVLVSGLLLVLARLVRLVARVVIRWLGRVLPRRLSVALGVTLVTIGLVLLYSGVAVRGFWAVANGTFAPRNAWEKPGVTGPPTAAERTGSPASPVSWESLGREGRAFVSLGPTRAQLQAADPAVPAKEPIRVFAGLQSAGSAQARAQLVLDELRRTDAFDREVLVLATTTGSGFIDPAGIDPLEHLWHGDTAVAGIQYSYLPSWLSLLADQATVQEASQAVFRTVYPYWAALPEDQRPRLYLYGLSLGSYGVQSVLTNVELLNQPIDGALMAGPPFVNPLHDTLTRHRDAGSPIWQPVFQAGRTVRFTARPSALLDPPGPWGPRRLAYLQHDTDPVVWFSPSLLLERAAWLEAGERGPNISPRFQWRPLVTMWQVLFDLPAAGTVPWGYGHLYLPSENLLGWAAVSQPPGWTSAALTELAAALDARGGTT
jgi:uncharacterized membrane protein